MAHAAAATDAEAKAFAESWLRAPARRFTVGHGAAMSVLDLSPQRAGRRANAEQVRRALVRHSRRALVSDINDPDNQGRITVKLPWTPPVGVLALLAALTLDVGIAARALEAAAWPVPAQVAAYLIAGTVWLLPLHGFLIWMETGHWR